MGAYENAKEAIEIIKSMYVTGDKKKQIEIDCAVSSLASLALLQLQIEDPVKLAQSIIDELKNTLDADSIANIIGYATDALEYVEDSE